MTRVRPMYAAVAVAAPVDHPLDYAVPATMRDQVGVGSRVQVPLGSRQTTGVVVGLRARASWPRIRHIMRVIDPQPLLTPALLRLGQWIAQRYWCSWGEALAAMTPPVTGRQGIAACEPSARDISARWSLPHDGSTDTMVPPAVLEALERRSAGPLVIRLATAIRPWDWLGMLLSRLPLAARPALIVVPEISHVEYLRLLWEPVLQDQAVFLHHQLPARGRRTAWGRLMGGGVGLVVGTRISIFAPLTQMATIVMMEEHDASYKQEAIPHYQTRDVVLERARRYRAVTLLVSATPSVEAWHACHRQRATLVDVPAPATRRLQLHVVDLREHHMGRRGNAPRMTLPLQRHLERALERNQRAVLLLNRTGFAAHVRCSACSHVLTCPQCITALTYFSQGQQLRCRWCNYAEGTPDRCPRCQGEMLQYRSAGIEKLHSELARRFPELSIARADRQRINTVRKRRAWRHQVAQGHWQLLLGTDMALHGWPLPRVDFCGVLDLDQALLHPGFRSQEQLIQRLIRAAQCVQWSQPHGMLMVQTRRPDQALLTCVQHDELAACYTEELAQRREAQLPPWTHLIDVVLRGRRQAIVEAHARALAGALHNAPHARGAAILGPAPLTPEKRRGIYWWHLLLRGRTIRGLTTWLARVLDTGRRWQGMPLTINVDPH